MISIQLDNLDDLITNRLKDISIAVEAGKSILGKNSFLNLTESQNNKRHTFWQYVIPVEDLDFVRNELFRNGVETGATNLMNLASIEGVELPNAKRLKESFVFIPVHNWISFEKYQTIYKSIQDKIII
ncbi:MAG: hypothetical protein IPH52_28640 [Leptospiraceae bacterium]|nr:hypothetical protein [Leptospiraceae bacterium]